MNKNILRLAIPNIITNITVPLLGMVDTAIVGHLDSELYIGAIAIAAMVFNFIYWNFSFLRMGTSGFTAQAYGAKDRQESVNILLRSLLVAFSLGIAIICLQCFIFRTAFYFVEASRQTQAFVAEYFFIYIWASPAILGMYTISGWFIGMQDAKTPMLVSIATNIINIALSFLFVFGFGLKIKGVAMGSALSQWIAFLLSCIIWFRKYGYLKPLLSFSTIKGISSFKPFFKVNSDIFLRSLALVFVTTFFTSASAKSGDLMLAINSLLMQLFILFSYMMDGFAYAAEALTGRYVGERDKNLFQKLIRQLFSWGLGLAALFTGVYALFTEDILRILTDKVTIIEGAGEFRWWALLFPVAGFAAFLWDGVYIGMTASRQMRNSMFVAVLCFFVSYYIFVPVWGNNGLWLSFIIYLSIRGVMQTFLFPGIRKGIFKS